MQSRYLKMGLVVFMIVAWAAVTWAVPILNDDGNGPIDVYYNKNNEAISYGWWTNSGVLIGKVQPGNNEGNFLESVETWLEEALGYDSSFELIETGFVNYTNYDNEGDIAEGATNTGTWEVVAPIEAISFYAVKAGNYYAMYLVDPAEGTGSWSTYDIWSAGGSGNDGIEISHFNGYNAAAPVPEPATLLLLGTGLIGLAGASRRKLFKK